MGQIVAQIVIDLVSTAIEIVKIRKNSKKNIQA